MANRHPSITWPVFEMCNENHTEAFEDMTRKLFNAHFAGNQELISDGINPGIEVLPVLECEAKERNQRKRISFQSKYFGKKNSYSDIMDSAEQTVKHYLGKIDKVYLFCNNDLRVTCDGYKSAEKILSDAGIELVPITNKRVLDLVFQYPPIYNYYFRPRDIPDLGCDSQPSFTIAQIVAKLSSAPSSEEMPSLDPVLLENLIHEKLVTCKKYILNLELDQLKAELDRLLSHNLSGIEGSDTLLFYQNLLNVHEGKPVEHLNVDGVYRTEIDWLKNFYLNPYEISFNEFTKHSDETQVFILNKLFATKKWAVIIALYEQKSGVECIWEQMELHYGLSLFNLQRYKEASCVLHKLFDKTKAPAHEMYSKFADIQLLNSSFRAGMAANNDALAELISSLNTFKGIKQYQSSELLVALLTMESYYYIGMSDKGYLEKAISAYDTFSNNVRNDAIVRFYYALCIEYNGDVEKAIALYETMQWKADETTAFRYLSCLILIGQNEKAWQQYGLLEGESKTERTYALSLFALNKIDAQKSRNLARDWLKTYTGNISSFVSFIIYMDDTETISSLIVPRLKKFIADGKINDLSFRQRVELIIWLAHNVEIEIMESVLLTIDDLTLLNDFTVKGIYWSLENACQKPNVFTDRVMETTTLAQAIEKIADRFLKAEIKKELFLRIKIACVNAKKNQISLLAYSKELFDLTHDETSARNIINLLVERKEDNASAYQPYFEALKNTEAPDQCMTIAAGLLLLGKEQEADRYAYRAIYYLNGEDNFDIYNRYFHLDTYNMRWLQENETEPVRSSKGDAVVTLESSSPSAEPVEWNVCLDSEKELSQDGNRSMDIHHLNPTDTDYLKIRSAGLNQVVKLKNGTFQVKRIVSRKKFCRSFVFGKMQANPDKFSGVIFSVSTENPEDMIEQLRKLGDRSEQQKANLRMYHFEDTSVGIPIEVVGFMDYDRYIGALKYLLLEPDEAFYAGEIIYAIDKEQSLEYIPTLSTLVLLSIMNRLDVLDVIKPRIRIPQSYYLFFREMLDKVLSDQARGVETLLFNGDKSIIVGRDPQISDVWERILDFCDSCETAEVTDSERMDFSFAQALRGEDLMTALKLSVIQLDALILAKRESAVYLSDDLFFRRMANWTGIKQCNTASILLLHENQEYRNSFAKDLAKTNYIYVPLAGISYKTIQEMQDDLLSGKRKKEFNVGWIQQYYAIMDAALQQLLGHFESAMEESTGGDKITTESN